MAQTLKDIEIICINDGSTDDSPAIIREYMERDARVKMIDKANSGYGDSMNRGLEMARGKYVGILESDDFMAPDALEKLVSAAERCNADFAKANFDFTGPSPRSAARCTRCLSPRTAASRYTRAIRRSSLSKSRRFGRLCTAVIFSSTTTSSSCRLQEHPFQDTSFAFKVIACADKAVYLHDAVLSYRQDNENSSVNSSAKVFCVNTEYAEIERWIRGICPRPRK